MEEQLNQIPAVDEVGTAAAESDTALAEHRAALEKMRISYALEQLYTASGARDPAMLGRLIDVENGDVVIGADGVPDVSAVKDKIDALHREKAYLFTDGGHDGTVSGKDTGGHGGTSAPRLGVITQTDVSQMDDASYYRALLGRKRAGR